jgi:hypothetical protein
MLGEGRAMTEAGGQGPFGWALGVAVVLVVLVVGLLGRAFAQRRVARRPAGPAGGEEPDQAPGRDAPPPAKPADPTCGGEPNQAKGLGSPPAAGAGPTPAVGAASDAHTPPRAEPIEAGPARAGPGVEEASTAAATPAVGAASEAADAWAKADPAPDGTESDSALASLDSGRFLTNLSESESESESPRPVVMPAPRAAADDVRQSGDAGPPGEPRPPEQAPPP